MIMLLFERDNLCFFFIHNEIDKIKIYMFKRTNNLWHLIEDKIDSEFTELFREMQ